MLIMIGILTILIGVFITAVAAILGSGKAEGKWAMVGFIGPFPFGTGSDKEFLKSTAIISMILLVLFLFLARKVLI
jgi:uncharacterized membrane protein